MAVRGRNGQVVWSSQGKSDICPVPWTCSHRDFDVDGCEVWWARSSPLTQREVYRENGTNEVQSKHQLLRMRCRRRSELTGVNPTAKPLGYIFGGSHDVSKCQLDFIRRGVSDADPQWRVHTVLWKTTNRLWGPISCMKSAQGLQQLLIETKTYFLSSQSVQRSDGLRNGEMNSRKSASGTCS